MPENSLGLVIASGSGASLTIPANTFGAEETVRLLVNVSWLGTLVLIPDVLYTSNVSSLSYYVSGTQTKKTCNASPAGATLMFWYQITDPRQDAVVTLDDTGGFSSATDALLHVTASIY